MTKLAKYEYGKNLELDIVAKKTLQQINNLVSVNKLPRGDYYELANIIQFYLDPDNNVIRLKQPGAVHHAIFLSQSIYYMKLKIMEKVLNFDINKAIEKEIDDMSEFVALFYGRWFLVETQSAAAAPRTDL